jgi:hypothetical protein
MKLFTIAGAVLLTVVAFANSPLFFNTLEWFLGHHVPLIPGMEYVLTVRHATLASCAIVSIGLLIMAFRTPSQSSD